MLQQGPSVSGLTRQSLGAGLPEEAVAEVWVEKQGADSVGLAGSAAVKLGDQLVELLEAGD